MSTDDTRLPTRRAAEYLGVEPATLRNWRWRGRGPRYSRLGQGPRARAVYRRGDLDDWLAARTFESTAEEYVRNGG